MHKTYPNTEVKVNEPPNKSKKVKKRTNFPYANKEGAPLLSRVHSPLMKGGIPNKVKKRHVEVESQSKWTKASVTALAFLKKYVRHQ